MGSLRELLEKQAKAYASEQGIKLLRFLGDGNDGAVWESTRFSAVKAIERIDSYDRERDAYIRLRDNGVSTIRGFSVPQLIDFDDSRQVVEMTVVFPPCLLDFAKSYVDFSPDFPAEAMSDWEAEAKVLFEDRWGVVRSVLASLRSFGIHYFDARPGNIRFEDEGEV